MGMENVERINGIREDIFNYNIDKALKNIITLLNDINLKGLDEEKFKNIIKYINISIENRDYVLMSDILKFELMPML